MAEPQREAKSFYLPGERKLIPYRELENIPIWGGMIYERDKNGVIRAPLMPAGTEYFAKLQASQRRPYWFASSARPETWGTLEQARHTPNSTGLTLFMGPAAHKVLREHGIDWFPIEIDLDEARTVNDDIKGWAAEELDACLSLAEYSVTDGIHIWGFVDPAQFEQLKKYRHIKREFEDGKLEVLGLVNHAAFITTDLCVDMPDNNLFDRIQHHAAQMPEPTIGTIKMKGFPSEIFEYSEAELNRLIPGFKNPKPFKTWKELFNLLPKNTQSLLNKHQEIGDREEKMISVVLDAAKIGAKGSMIFDLLKQYRGTGGVVDSQTNDRALLRQILRIYSKFGKPSIFWSEEIRSKVPEQIEHILTDRHISILVRAGKLRSPITAINRRDDGVLIRETKLEEVSQHWLLEMFDDNINLVQWKRREHGFKNANGGWEREEVWEVVSLGQKQVMGICNHVIDRHNRGLFKPVYGILECQSMRPDGTIIDREGFDEQTGFFLVNPPAMDPVPEEPTKRDVARARKLIEDLLRKMRVDDKLTEEEEDTLTPRQKRKRLKRGQNRAAALAALMTGPLKPIIGLTPAVMIISKKLGQSSGKGFLRDTISKLMTGSACSAAGFIADEKEMDNRFIGLCAQGVAITSLDNINDRTIKNESLSRFITEEKYGGRLFYGQGPASFTHRPIMILCGNNIPPGEDFVRRSLLINLVPWDIPASEQNWGPGANAHELLEQDRGKYVWAVLTIVRAFLLAKSRGLATSIEPPMPSFAKWSDLVRSAVVWIGYEDAMKTMLEAYYSTDEMRSIMETKDCLARHFGIYRDVTYEEINHAVLHEKVLEPIRDKCLNSNSVYDPEKLRALLPSLRRKCGPYDVISTDRRRRSPGANPKAGWMLIPVPGEKIWDGVVDWSIAANLFEFYAQHEGEGIPGPEADDA